MSVVLRLVAALLATIAAWAGGLVPSTAASVSEVITCPIYAYDSPARGEQTSYTAPERGPPAACDWVTTYNANDAPSGGASARPDAPTPRVTNDYDLHALPAQLPHAAGTTTQDPVRALVGDLSLLTRAGVAAKTVDDILPTPQVGSQGLQNHIDALYKGTTNPNRVGNGTTMDAIRNELATGVPTPGRMHSIKGQERLNGLNKWLRRNPDAPYNDRLVAQSLADELSLVLRGGG